jgi:tRNA-specific adenosine deaminase 1
MAQHSIRVLAIGTGTKCLGASKRSPAGDVLNDSHAEVIARRAFVAWVYQQLQLAAAQELQPHQADPAVTSAGHAANPPKAAAASEVCQNQSGTPAAAAAAGKQQSHPTSKQKQQSAFVWCPETRRFALRPGIRFALYVSQPPCGDASIFSRLDTEACCGADQGASAVGGGSSNDTASPQQQQQQAVGRTGAKLLRPLGAADIADAAASAAAAATAADAAASSADEAAGQIGLHSDKPNEQTQQQTKQQQQQAEQQQQYVVPTARHVEAGPQQLGVLRRKPGKGDPTLSLSCSDKIARWACLGLQGCLLSSILQEPLYLGMIVVYVPVLTDAAGGGGQQQDGQQQGVQQVGCGAGSMLAAAEAAGRRAFGERLAGCAEELRGPYRVVQPQVVAVGAADMQLGLQPGGSRTVPSGEAILLVENSDDG